MLEEVLLEWKNNRDILDQVTRWVVMPETAGEYREFPRWLDPRLIQVLQQEGVDWLYLHQFEAMEAINRGEHTVIVTPTASGKTLCYNLPVLNRIMQEPHARALYLFPTKALSRDQVAGLLDLVNGAGIDLHTFTYDGDTNPSTRSSIRQKGHIVVTNPDMLHSGILPHHTKWIRLFENLRYVVIDEVHQYRGVFGSHLANVLRRLKRIAAFYGVHPQFILCSATIANPKELAQSLLEEPVTEINSNGAPQPEKHFLFYNPPLVNKDLGIRRSILLEAQKLGTVLIQKGIQTIIFTRSRLNVEILLSYLRQKIKSRPGQDSGIRGYRGGYLPRERRAIEEGLRSGEIKGVVSTNALELGIDIGQLEACIITGYPGSIASTWQQAGRAGRRSGLSLAILVASSAPLDQYLVTHPDYFLGRSPEHALINPDNLIILTNHVRCAAFELPFREGERFGRAAVEEILQFLTEEEVLYHSDGRFHWMEDSFPAEEISLRSASSENVVIIDTTPPHDQVIGEVDRFSAPMLVHEEAIYMHGGQQYQVEKLDLEEKKAFVRQVSVNYFTDANLSVDLRVLEVFEEAASKVIRSWGEVRVNALVSIFKKIKFHTHENIGSGHLKLPEMEMHTTAFWLSFPEGSLQEMLPSSVQSGLIGLSYLAARIAPLFLMGDPRDLKAVCQVKAPFTDLPTLYLYDNYPGGVGYSQALYTAWQDIFHAARQIIYDCRCEDGCPSCIGPAEETGQRGKEHTLRLLEVILD
jgi:DEAD/DEAH box helicase domain-containing protein